MKMMRHARVLGAATVLSLVMVACSAPADPEAPSDPESEGSEEAVEPDSDNGLSDDEITIAAHVETATLESSEAFNSFNGTVLRNIFEVLVERDRETNEFIPALATSWEQVDDTTWHFNLREDVQFHDGSDFDAEAAAASFTHLYEGDIQSQGGARNYAPGSMEFQAIETHLLEVVTEVVDPVLPETLRAAPISSAEQLATSPEAYADTPIGTGPYKFVNWDRGSQVVLERNEDWWALEGDHGLGFPYYSRATFLFRPDPSSRTAALQANEVDLAERLPPELCQQQLEAECVDAPQSDVVLIKVDMVNPVLGDERIREAMSLALDRELIAQELLGGAEPSMQIVGPAVVGYNDSISVDGYDLDRATELVDEARADGVPVDETVLQLSTREDSFPGNDQVLEVVLAAWEGIGLTLTAEIQDRVTFNDHWIMNHADVSADRASIGLHKHTNEFFDFAPSANFYWACDGVGSPLCLDEAETLYQEGRVAAGDERERLLQEANAIWAETRAILPVANQLLFHGVSDTLNWSPRSDMQVLLRDMEPAN